MAGTSVIGALRVVLGADTAALDKGLADSQKGLSNFGIAVGAGMAAAAAAVAAAAYQIAGSIKGVIDQADNFNKLSQKTGLSVEELSKLSLAAELADVSSETLAKSMGKLSKAMVEGAGDASSQAARAFTAMGVAIKNQDGTLRSSSDTLKDIAEKFAGYKDGAEKTSLAIALFGKAGAAMIPLLNEGRDGLQEAADKAEQYGLVLDKKTTVAAQAFNDNLKLMDKIKQGVITTMTAKMLPAFEALTATILKSREESTLYNAVGDALAGVVNKIAGAAIALITTWQQLFATVANLRTAFSQLKDGDFSAAWETMKKSAVDTSAALSGLATNVRMLVAPTDVEKSWSDQLTLFKSVNEQVVELGKNWTQVAAPIVAAGAAQKDAVQKFLDAQLKRAAAQVAEADATGKTAAQQAYLKTVYEAQQIALSNNIPMTAALAVQITLAGQAAANASLQLQAANIAQQVLTPAQKYAQDLTNLQTVYANTTMTAETFAARQQQLAEQAGASWGIAGESIAGSFTKIASSFSKESAGMATAAKIFGAIQATISMFTGAAKALELPLPANLAAMAAVLAKGAALVASIKSQTIPTGMKEGGFVSGPGGARGDKIPTMLSDGEFVVNAGAAKQNASALMAMNSGSTPSGGSVATVVMQGFAWSRDQMADFAAYIREMQRDGHKIEMKFA